MTKRLKRYAVEVEAVPEASSRQQAVVHVLAHDEQEAVQLVYHNELDENGMLLSEFFECPLTYEVVGKPTPVNGDPK